MFCSGNFRCSVFYWLKKWDFVDITCLNQWNNSSSVELVLHITNKWGHLFWNRMKPESYWDTQNQKHIFFPLTSRAIYPSRMIFCELQSFGASCRRDQMSWFMERDVGFFKFIYLFIYFIFPLYSKGGRCLYGWLSNWNVLSYKIYHQENIEVSSLMQRQISLIGQ